MLGTSMDETNQLLLTAMTLLLAKEIRAEIQMTGQAITEDQAINQAVMQIQQKKVAVRGQFGVRHF